MFQMNFQYDALNRIQSIIYPDGEKLSYIYDKGGNLQKIFSDQTTYINQIQYNRYGLIKSILYGNKTLNLFEYDPQLHRLQNKQVLNPEHKPLLNISYQYDFIGNITQMKKSNILSTELTGQFNMEFLYDDLNRLVTPTANLKTFQAITISKAISTITMSSN